MNAKQPPLHEWHLAQRRQGEILLSIIITSYNQRKFLDLKELIESIIIQGDLNSIELLMIIEHDITLYEHLKNFMSIHGSVDFRLLFFEQLSGMSEARNIGAQVASGEYLAFLDDDVVLNQGWLVAFLSSAKQDWIVFTGPSDPLWIDHELSWVPLELSWIIGSTRWFQSSQIVSIRNAWGNNMVVHRKEFLEIGGFSRMFGLNNASRRKWVDPPSEDVDLSLRLRIKYGKMVTYVPALSVKHKVSARKMSWKFVIQRAYSVGYQRFMMKKIYPSIPETLSPERDVVERMILLWPKTISRFFRSPKNAMSALTILFLVSLFSIMGYYDRRPYSHQTN